MIMILENNSMTVSSMGTRREAKCDSACEVAEEAKLAIPSRYVWRIDVLHSNNFKLLICLELGRPSSF